MRISQAFVYKAAVGLLLGRVVLLLLGIPAETTLWGVQTLYSVSSLVLVPCSKVIQWSLGQVLGLPVLAQGLTARIQLPSGIQIEPDTLVLLGFILIVPVVFQWGCRLLSQAVSQSGPFYPAMAQVGQVPLMRSMAPVNQMMPVWQSAGAGNFNAFNGFGGSFMPIPVYPMASVRPQMVNSPAMYGARAIQPSSRTQHFSQGSLRPVSILFADIRGYTALSETYPPEWIIHQLNDYFAAMTQVILAHQGCVDKYMGDAIMAFFESPDGCVSTSARHAVLAVFAMQRALAQLNQKWRHYGLPQLDIRIGVNTGEVFMGNIGSSHKMDYTIIGDPVNLASRLEQMNKAHKTRVIISEYTYACVKDLVEVRYLGQAPVRGKQQQVKIYELRDLQMEKPSPFKHPEFVR